MILPHYKIIIIHSLTAVIVNSNTTGYELEVFRGHLVRAMTCPTLIYTPHLSLITLHIQHKLGPANHTFRVEGSWYQCSCSH